MTTPDVLIVGAGPTGLALAGGLMRYGVSVRIVDKAPRPQTHNGTPLVHPRTLEIFDQLEALDPMLALGRKLDGLRVMREGRLVQALRFVSADNAFPYTLVLDQTDIEMILRQRLSDGGCRIDREVTFASLSQDDEGVLVSLHMEDGDCETERYRFVIGCDGPNSAVRRSLGVGCAHQDSAERFMVADVKIRGALEPDAAYTFIADAHVLTAIPLPDYTHHRVTLDLDPDAEPDLDDSMGLSVLLAQRTSLDLAVESIVSAAIFNRRPQRATSLQEGNVLLVGDAAHTHPPGAGQGLNSGVHGAFNLAWKLAMTLDGRVTAAVLPTYAQELGALSGAEQTENLTLRQRFSHMLRPTLDERRDTLSTLGMIGHTYHANVLSEEHNPGVLDATMRQDLDAETPSWGSRSRFLAAPHAGSPAPDVKRQNPEQKNEENLYKILRRPSFLVFLFDGRAPTEAGYAAFNQLAKRLNARWGASVDTFVITPADARPEILDETVEVLLDSDEALLERYGAQSECVYVIRPDGHVSFRAQPLNTTLLMAHLERVLV